MGTGTLKIIDWCRENADPAHPVSDLLSAVAAVTMTENVGLHQDQFTICERPRVINDRKVREMCSSCPPQEQLAAYLTGMLAEDLASKLEGHLTTCRRCERVLNEWAARSRATDAPLRQSEAGDAMVVRPGAESDGAGVAQPGADYHLLFGLLALQNDFVSREELVTATSVWLLDKSRSLGDILRERGAIAEDEYQLLSALVAKHLEHHGRNAAHSLAALSSIGTVRDDLLSLGDADVGHSLAHVAVAREPEVEDSHRTCVAGGSSSAGQRFRFLRPHARGGLGQVSVALDDELNREVALKEMLPEVATRPDSRSRFVMEAEITGGLEHPGIVPVYGLGQYADGRPFYAMRFIKGDSLQEAVKRFHQENKAGGDSASRGIALRNLLGRFVDVCQAIEYAHSRRVLHRDLKPGNIMLGKYGETLVVDWGLAKALGGRESEVISDEQTLRPRSSGGSAPTQLGSAIGTPAYMSPEQAAGRVDELGPASDVYGLGATLYYLLAGHSPFPDSDAGLVLRNVQAGEFRRPREVNRAIPAALEAICLKAMALRAQDRYAAPQALADDIERWMADESVSCHEESWTERSLRWVRRHRSWTIAGSTALGVVLVALVATVIVLRIWNVKYQEGLYLSLSRLSQAAMYRGDVGTVDMLFEEAFPRVSVSLRGWEYGYVNRSRRAEEAVFRTGVGIKLAAISRDREILVTVSNENRLRGWRIDDQKEIWAGDVPGDCEVLSIALNSAGDRVAFATNRRDAAPPSQALHIWRLNGNSLNRQTTDLPRGAWAVGFSHDDARVATADDSGSLCLFDAESLTLQHTYADHGGPLCAVAFRRDGAAIATGGFLADSFDGFFTVWDLETHRGLLTATRQYAVRSLDFGPGGSDLYVGYDWGMVDKWNVASSAIRQTFWEHELAIRCIASGPDHKWFAFGSSDRRISLYGAAPYRVIAGHWSPVIAMQFSPDGNRLTTVGTSGFVRTWSTLRAQNHIAPPTLARAVAISPDGTLATGGAKGTALRELSAGKIALWDRSYHLKQTIDTPFATVQDIFYSPGGEFLVALGNDHPEYSVDTRPQSLSVLTLDGREIASISASSLGVTAAAFQADDRLLIGTATGTLISAPIRAMPDAATIDTCDEPITCLCASPAKGTIAYAYGNEIRVRQNGALVRTHRVAVKPVRRVVLSHDGALLAATSGGFSETEAIGELIVWRTSDGKQVLRLSGEDELYSGVLGLAFSPDGKRLFVTTYEHTTSIIRVKDGAGLFDLTCQQSPVIDIDISNDGLRVATVGLDGTVVVCEATPWD